MYLENQVCSPELSKRLKELGIKQESLFYWADGSIVISIDMDLLISDKKVRNSTSSHHDSDEDIYKIYSAFTVAELSEMLPIWFDSGKRENDDWICRVMEVRKNKKHHSFGKTEADARAKMLIYLLENKLMELSNE